MHFKRTGTAMGRYVLEFGGAMLGYFATLVAVISTRPHMGRDWVELMPTIPLLFALWAILRQYERCDEFLRRIHSEAFALGAILVGTGVMVWGFAENAGAPPLGSIWFAPALLAAWGLCLPIVIRRYR